MNSTSSTRRQFLRRWTAAATLATGLPGCSRSPQTSADGRPVIRFGHFPNITHVQALVARHHTRQGNGWFETRLGAEIQWFSYNAGPSAIEAIFARALDVTYIGPSPVLNAYAKSQGAEPRILAGAANGGSALVVRPGAGIQAAADFRGKRVASPQPGNTQDVQLRAWLTQQGYKVTQTGGDVHVLPIANPDQFALFQRGELDASWSVEPWVSRLELEAGARVFLEDRETNVTMLVARTAWHQTHAELARGLVSAHRELTDWVKAHPEESRAAIKAELQALTTMAPSDTVVDRALERTVLTTEVSRPSLETMVQNARSVGFLEGIPALDGLWAAQ